MASSISALASLLWNGARAPRKHMIADLNKLKLTTHRIQPMTWLTNDHAPPLSLTDHMPFFFLFHDSENTEISGGGDCWARNGTYVTRVIRHCESSLELLAGTVFASQLQMHAFQCPSSCLPVVQHVAMELWSLRVSRLSLYI